ncbi:FG-GAP repeat domain-containing protein [Dyella humicola]|uniref:FG-GAP repeat domain-containing protein n=1 Tax=Dyella humicola TaxID=2992126 RepID=UPI002255F8CC|nr:VCBS repeat-containing protein [Dyella humicola]
MSKALRAFIVLAVASGVFAPVAHAFTNPPDQHVEMGGHNDTATTIQRNFPAPESALCLAGECVKSAAATLAAPRAATVAAQTTQIVCKGVTYNHPIPYDLNGDCISELLWMNDQTHQFGWWLLGSPYSQSGTQYLPRTVGGTVSVTPGYWIAASGDFNGDFKADLIWTSNNRDLYLWTSTGTGFSSQYVGTYPAGWKLVGAADIDGDGIDDLIWGNDDACEFGYWLMNGNTIKSTKIISTTCGFQVAFIDTAFDSPNKTTPAIYWINVSNPNYTSTSLYRWLPQSDTLNSVFLGYTGGASIIGVQTQVMYSPLLILNQAGVPETCQDIQNQCYPNTAGISIPGPGQYSIVAAGHYSSPASQDLLWASTDGGLVVANYTLTGSYPGAAPYNFYKVAGFPTGWHIVRPGKQN